ncbi:unnamed protein product [Cylicocyclus nassatus]|uniref:Uncharacterized protein n=1 Tax=Cylicocyclus nassatus TaxID=53992 RepID=A0AA36DIG0_CYLNA|nr:unnamed protein product [Cylicocyclus nassatus]
MKLFVLVILVALCVGVYPRRICKMVHKRYKCQDGECVMVRLCWPRPNHYITYDLCMSKCEATTASTNTTET